jgi:hypothetical protein
MQIEQRHELGQKEAIRRIDTFLDELMRREPPGGVTIKHARKDWDGNRMSFSVAAAKGFFGATIQGVMEVMADRVVVNSDLPALLQGVVGEDRIRDTIARELGRLLGPAPA